jgi:hypothetical protein
MSNNVYHDCPPLMSLPGGFITYNNSTNELASHIKHTNGITSSNRLRTYMQKNANQFMENERKYHQVKNNCKPNLACSEGYWYVNQYQTRNPRIPNTQQNQWAPY